MLIRLLLVLVLLDAGLLITYRTDKGVGVTESFDKGLSTRVLIFGYSSIMSSSLEDKVGALQRLLVESRANVDASRVERQRQRRRVADVLRDIEASETIQYRSSIVRNGAAEMAKLEKLNSSFSTAEKAATVRALLQPLSLWNDPAKSLIQLIDLDLNASRHP